MVHLGKKGHLQAEFSHYGYLFFRVTFFRNTRLKIVTQAVMSCEDWSFHVELQIFRLTHGRNRKDYSCFIFPTFD